MKRMTNGADVGARSVDHPSQLGTKGVVRTPVIPINAPKSASKTKSREDNPFFTSTPAWVPMKVFRLVYI